MKVTLIHNPDAGNEDQPSGDEIISMIRRAGHSVLYQSAKQVGWDNVLQESADIVAVAGGDGTVGKIAKRLVGRRIPIGVLPMGTANNVARALGLFTDTMFRLETQGNVDHACLNASGEKITSALEIVRKFLATCPASRLNVTLDDQNLAGEYILLEAMNIRSIGPNLDLAPDADPGDGLLDFVLVSKTERDQLSKYLTDRIEGKPSSLGLLVRRSRRVRIECEGLPFHIDDELWPDDGSRPSSSVIVDASVGRESLEMLTPT
jgi:diacylglycerol kinase (ATP)